MLWASCSWLRPPQGKFSRVLRTNFMSCRAAPLMASARGMPWSSVSMLRLMPPFPRSVALGLVFSRLAVLSLSRHLTTATTSQCLATYRLPASKVARTPQIRQCKPILETADAQNCLSRSLWHLTRSIKRPYVARTKSHSSSPGRSPAIDDSLRGVAGGSEKALLLGPQRGWDTQAAIT